MSTYPYRSSTRRTVAARPNVFTVAFVRFVCLFVCVVGAASCNSVLPPFFDGPIGEGPPILDACPAFDDADVAAKLPKALPVSPSVAAGTISGSFSVSATGEALYSMPLTVPPGRAGVQPSLSILYDSAAGEGPLGSGFTLGGLSAITRCPKTIADDNGIEPVQDSSSDAFCLDGRRLVPVDEASERPVEFRTLPDTLTKIVADYAEGDGWDAKRGPRSFVAYTRAGLITEYGSAESGRILAMEGVVRSWQITRTRDRNGNAEDFSYFNTIDPVDGFTIEHAISRIDYTSHPDAPASFAVTFDYSARAPGDVQVLFARGMQLQRSLRLDHIRMLGPGDKLVRQYNFVYSMSSITKRLLLKQIEECAADQICKPPTRFGWSQSKSTGFSHITTPINAPLSKLASVMLADVSGDGLDDIVIADVETIEGAEELPITDWIVAKNTSAWLNPPYFAGAGVAYTQNHDITPIPVHPELGTIVDVDGNGAMDVFLHDIYGKYSKWRALVVKPDLTFGWSTTGLVSPTPPGPASPLHLNTEQASIHLADVSGDGMTDFIRCSLDNGIDFVWRLHLWKPDGPGFDVSGTVINELEGRPCNARVETVDIDADGRTDLLVQKAFGQGLADKFEALSFVAKDDSWTIQNPNLQLPPNGGRLVFLDANGDALPDVVVMGLGEPLTLFNTGRGFATLAQKSLLGVSPGADTFGDLATVIDFNADGKQDLLMPMPAAGGIPEWTLLKSTGSVADGTFEPVDAGIPFEALLAQDEAVTLADPHGPRVTDVDGDGIQDVIIILNKKFHVFKNKLHEEDLLVSVTDGLNAHDAADAGYLPNVQITYDHLVDVDKATSGLVGLPKEAWTYLSKSESATDECAYPIRCVVGPRRVVSQYTLATGETTPRTFAMAYRNGRYDRLGRGFLGFGERITRDTNTGAGTLEIYDTTTFDKDLRVFPFAGQPSEVWHWSPPTPAQQLAGETAIELAYTTIQRELVKTLGGRSYFTIPVKTRTLREQGDVPETCDPVLIEAYVRDTAINPAYVMSDSVWHAWSWDEFGNVLHEVSFTQLADDWLETKRSFENRVDDWLLGLPTSETTCGTAGLLKNCRTALRAFNDEGLLDTESTSADNGDLETVRKTTLSRDDFGNVIKVSEKDGFGYQRSSCTSYDVQGIYPFAHRNAAGHLTLMAYDGRLGAQTALVDPNGLVTQWAYDGLGAITKELRPDGTATKVTTLRSKDGGLSQDAWSVKVRTQTTGGEDTTVELDSMARPVRAWQQNTKTDVQAPPRVMQEIHLDALGENVARSLVPASEQAAPNTTAFDAWSYDGIGRPLVHKAPWGALTTYRYTGRNVEITGPNGVVTLIENDPKGRPVKITDAELGVMTYSYGAFGALRTVLDPNLAKTTIERDGLGQVRSYKDPDRGTTETHYDGFGRRTWAVDEAGRTFVFQHDALDRPASLTTPDGPTIWTYDTAPNGLGQLAKVVSPGDTEVAYTYDTLSRPVSVTKTVNGEKYTASNTYDAFGRTDTITYPAASGLSPFVVQNEYDVYGHLVRVRDASSKARYWELLTTDPAGRVQKEQLGTGAGAATTTRLYDQAKSRVEAILTSIGASTVQCLSYHYDDRLNLTNRIDIRQGVIESFLHDQLDRVTDAWFSGRHAKPLKVKYYGNGNISSKSDVGQYGYSPFHPHAVWFAGGELYVNDAVGNQVVRPGATVEYTAFDKPKRFSLDGGAGTIDLDYDGNLERVRKTTPQKEIVYFGSLYERATPFVGGDVEHTFYVYNNERLVATVTRKLGDVDKTSYVHVDHLGSIDAVTDVAGAVVERRSFDIFGAPRDPDWGGPNLGKPKLRRGFTGHEPDAELGLVNMKGREYDPKLGRFLTADPLLGSPHSSQAWNRLSYVGNRPLAFTDPTGFTGEPAGGAGIDSSNPYAEPGEGGELEIVVRGHKKEREGPREAQDAGAMPTPADVNVTGNVAGGQAAPPGTAGDEPTRRYTVGDIALGGLRGLANAAIENGTYGVIEVLTGVDLRTWGGVRAAIEGIQNGGILGYLDAVNPFSSLIHGAETAYDAAIAGDFPKVTETLAPIVVTTIIGIIAGGKAKGGSPTKGAPTAAAEGAEASGSAPKGGTYQLLDRETGEVIRNGRSGDLLRRGNDHKYHPDTRDLKFRIKYRTDDYAEQRGLEQRQMNSQRGVLDKIRGIAPKNPKFQAYMDAAARFLKEDEK